MKEPNRICLKIPAQQLLEIIQAACPKIMIHTNQHPTLSVYYAPQDHRLPEDAVIASALYDPVFRQVEIYLDHPELPMLDPGEQCTTAKLIG